MQWRSMALAGLAAFALGSAGPAQTIVDSCTPGPYIVFFDPGLPFLDKEARATLDGVAENADNCGDARVMLRGFTDTSERAGVDKRRLEVVRDYLAARGIPGSEIEGEALGTSHLRVETGPGVSERQNRRVDITFGPPA